MEKWIVADPEHLGGKPRVAGTRISIEFLLETLACGMTIPEIVREYPTLTEEAIKGALENMPESVRIALGRLGHQVDSVASLRLKGLDNGP